MGQMNEHILHIVLQICLNSLMQWTLTMEQISIAFT